VPGRAALTGILFVLRTGIGWEYLPQEVHGGSGMTCWRRLRDGEQAGVWDKLWQLLWDELGQADAIDWVGRGDGQFLHTGALWGAQTGPHPTDRGKTGTKRHLITGEQGIPLAMAHTGANVHDSQMAIPLVDAIQPIQHLLGCLADVPTRYSPIRRTTPRKRFVSRCGGAALHRESPGAAKNPAAGWAFFAGW